MNFIDQGEYLEAIVCSSCGTRNEIDFFKEDDPIVLWWHEIGELIEVGNHSVKMPCCSVSVDSISLKFDPPAGFAVFEIDLVDPDWEELTKDGQLHSEHVGALQNILCTELKQISCKY